MRSTVMLAVLLSSFAAHAQGESARAVQDLQVDLTRRTLRGHTFLLPADVDSAFIQTVFSTRTSVRYETIGDIPIGPRLFDLNSIGAREQFEFSLALSDILDVGVLAFGQFLTGTNGQSIAAQGALYGYGGALNGGIRIARIDSSGTQIAARAQLLGVEGGERFNLLPILRAVRNDPIATIPAVITNFGDTMVTKISWLDIGASLDVAQVITRAVSLQGMFRLDMQRVTRSPFVPGQGRVDTSDTTWMPSAGLAVDVRSAGFPVAAMAEYRLAARNSSDLTSLTPRHTVTLGVYYVGQQNLQLGPVLFGEFGLLAVDGIDLNGNPAGSNEGEAFVGQMMVSYYW